MRTALSGGGGRWRGPGGFGPAAVLVVGFFARPPVGSVGRALAGAFPGGRPTENCANCVETRRCYEIYLLLYIMDKAHSLYLCSV